MKTWTMRTLIALAVSVACSGVAWADNGDGKPCQLNTLRGSYVFTATGFNIGTVPVPKAIVELIDFDGDGALTVPGGTVSVNGVINHISPGGVGEYTMESDCTGVIAFTQGPTFRVFIEPTGKSGWMIQINNNTVFQGTLTLLHR